MKIKHLLFVISFIGTCSLVTAQEYPVDKNATIIAGSGIFTSKGGDLFEVEGNNSTTFTLTPTINHFITKGFFVGGGIELSTQSQGDYSLNSIGIGPQIGYAFGTSQSTMFPYIDLGIRYYKMNADYGLIGDSQISGSDIFLGFGVIFPVKNHIGLIFEGGYHMMDLSEKDTDDTVSGNVLSIGIGIAGLLFQDGK